MLVLARHGLSLYNEANLLTGRTDSKLSDDGIIEAETLGNEIKDKSIRFDYIFTSPMSRTIDTANIILEKTFSVCDVITDERLVERDCGDLTGISKEEALITFGQRKFRNLQKSFDIPYPNGESFDNVVDRIISWVEEELLPLQHKGHTLIISHHHVLRALSMLLGIIKDEEIHTFPFPTGKAIYVPWINLKKNILL